MKGLVLIMKYRFILMRGCDKAGRTFWFDTLEEAAEELAVLMRAFNAINYGITGAYSECTCDVNMIKED